MNQKYPLLIGAIALAAVMGQPVHAASNITNFQPSVTSAQVKPAAYILWGERSDGSAEDARQDQDIRNTTPGVESPQQGPISSDAPVE